MSSNSFAATETASNSIEVTIERILPGGVGLAHAGGRTLFVALAAPGDVVRVRIDRARGKMAFASIEEIIKPSTVRVEPPCPYFGACGGCDFQQLTYQAQLDAKVEMIRDCLRRIAHVENLPEIPIMPSPLQWHYRSRANWQVDRETRAFGFFERGSHRVCDVADCAVLAPELQDTMGKLRISRLPKNVLDLEAAIGDDGVSLYPALKDFPTAEITRKIGAETYQFSAEAFFQTNEALLEPLIAAVTVGPRGATAMDLYCGVGLFTVPLARRFGLAGGIEANPDAAIFARRNLERAGLPNGKVATQPVAEWLHSYAASFAPIDLLVLDPPRTGVEEGAIEGMLRLKAREIVYVSCDPATLARDLKELFKVGYTLTSVAAFDMFPQTHHVETVVKLERPTRPVNFGL
jgi:23S rRNA (uracil1939-C5)-methyltransferase